MQNTWVKNIYQNNFITQVLKNNKNVKKIKFIVRVADDPVVVDSIPDSSVVSPIGAVVVWIGST